MGTLAEYKRKTLLYDGKPKMRVWMVSLPTEEGVPFAFPVALFTDEKRADVYAERFGGRAKVELWLTDSADESLRREFMKLLGEEE